ncbi:MAG: hypothetical protein ACXW03_02615 [Methylobacter sp.]
MRIKTRLNKLEQRKAPFPTIGRVIVTQGQSATEQWLKEHPGQPLPELLIVRVIVPPPQPMH